MISREQAQARAKARLVARTREWAVAGVLEGPPIWSIGLQPPTEAEVRRDERGAERWATDWLAAVLPNDVVLTTTVRTWRSIGRQTVPVKLEAGSVDALAAFVGGAVARDFQLLRARVGEAAEGMGEPVRGVLRRHGASILALGPQEWRQVLDVADHLASHPVVGLRPRSLPIRGVDSKWFSAHRALVTALVTAATGLPDLGVVDSDPLVRLRVLDPSLAPGAVADFAAPVTQLGALDLRPAVTLILENRETLLALPPMPGVVAVHGGGFAVSTVAEIPWVRARPVLYWGDLDSAGFAILNRLRSHHDQVTSVLMDAGTLISHRDLWVPDPTPVRAALEGLFEAEAAVVALLRDQGDVRLEQERIPLSVAVGELERVRSEGFGLPIP